MILVDQKLTSSRVEPALDIFNGVLCLLLGVEFLFELNFTVLTAADNFEIAESFTPRS